MTARKYSNTFAETTLSGSINNSVTTITIGSTTGLPASFPYTLAIDYGTASVEMVTVTALAGSNLTVTRGQDGTSAQSHTGGARVVHPVTARDLSEPQVHIDSSSDIHGLSGGASVVGTSQAQTLTNKTISGSTNTLTNIPNSAIVAVDATKITMPFARITDTGADGTNEALTVTGDEVSRTTPIATVKRGGLGLVVGEDAVVQVTSGGLDVDPTQRLTGAGSLPGRLVVKAQGKTGVVVDQNTAETNDFVRLRDPSATIVFKVTSTGAVTSNTSITATTSLNGATAAITGNATVGGTLGVTSTLTASGGVTVTGGVTASGTVQGATVNSTGNVTATGAVNATGAVTGASAAITGGVTTGTAGVTVAAETWNSMTLQNSWANFGSGFANAKYRKTIVGSSIEIIGTISGGVTTNGTVVANLPAGYRPVSNIRNVVYAQGGSLNVSTETPGCTLNTSGDLTLVGCGSANTVAFHCIIPLDA